jgi:integrase
VRASKTDAGMRRVDLLPVLRDELLAHKAGAADIGPDALVFSSQTGGGRDKDTVRNRVLQPAIQRANENLTNRGDLPLPERLTLHGLRHT